MQQSSERRAPSDVEALTAVTRDLVGVALRSIEPEAVSVPQFRLLLTLHERGAVSSAQMARTLGLVASSVTRLVDRLVSRDLVARGSVPEHRGVVALSLTPAGQELVDRVLRRREAELSGVLDCLTPDVHATTLSALWAIHDLLGQDEAIAPVVL